MYILGISAFYHDSAAVLLKDGEVVAAAQEERFTRIKQDSRFPVNAIEYCLHECCITAADVDVVVYYEKPNLKLWRYLKNHAQHVFNATPQLLERLPNWLVNKYNYKKIIQSHLGKKFKGDIVNVEHHLSHAASAYFPSPYEQAAVLTVDGVGEVETSTIYYGEGSKLTKLYSMKYPHSLGILYSIFTSYCGFKINSGEYKLMGLAPYGRPKYADTITQELVKIFEDGSISLNLKYFPFTYEDRSFNENLIDLLGFPPRDSESELTQEYANLASSIQQVTDEIMLKMAKFAKSVTGAKYLCLAGGVALNCVSNKNIAKNAGFEDVWIQPASGDAGGALGAALHYYHSMGNPRNPNWNTLKGALLGPEYTKEEILKVLDRECCTYKEFDEHHLVEFSADLLANNNVVGWFQGRMEFGPRALGNRSILGNPKSPTMQRNMNLKIKFRESFRPFAPSVLAEFANEYFDCIGCTDYMLITADVLPLHRKVPFKNQRVISEQINEIRSTIPAVTHVDYSARVQTVRKEFNSIYHKLISRFKDKTGCPLLINTSFNVRGEPIVCSPEDALRCFVNTEMDALVIGSFVLLKSEQTALKLEENYVDSFEKD